ncbi:hypothetical protein ASZ90_017246 [hydrocarbon metagenome]|uniref:Uncharacterized protein n=1 Tax=hydrocarbon metagenome TaxID=938273 RepID=A0A0W8EA22_9ZZZZ
MLTIIHLYSFIIRLIGLSKLTFNQQRLTFNIVSKTNY